MPLTRTDEGWAFYPFALCDCNFAGSSLSQHDKFLWKKDEECPDPNPKRHYLVAYNAYLDQVVTWQLILHYKD